MKTAEHIVLDTDIVIHVLKKQATILKRFINLYESGVTFLISPIVVAEIYAGAFVEEHRQVEAFFGLCQKLQLDHGTARMAGIYANRFCKAWQGISMEDFLLAATAKMNHCPLWTGNLKHYPMDDIELFLG